MVTRKNVRAARLTRRKKPQHKRRTLKGGWGWKSKKINKSNIHNVAKMQNNPLTQGVGIANKQFIENLITNIAKKPSEEAKKILNEGYQVIIDNSIRQLNEARAKEAEEAKVRAKEFQKKHKYQVNAASEDLKEMQLLLHTPEYKRMAEQNTKPKETHESVAKLQETLKPEANQIAKRIQNLASKPNLNDFQKQIYVNLVDRYNLLTNPTLSKDITNAQLKSLGNKVASQYLSSRQLNTSSNTDDKKQQSRLFGLYGHMVDPYTGDLLPEYND